MKRGVIILMLFGVILFSCLVYADCDSNKVIMKLYSQNNSHAGLWNDTSYSQIICSPSVINRDCANPLLWLYSSTNSHVSTTNLTGYNIPICFPDGCSVADGACPQSAPLPVASLYSRNNSHIALDDFSGYNIKVCCGGVGVFGSLHWENMVNQPINRSRAGASVRAVVPGTNLAGKSISYEMWKSVKWWWDDKVALSSVQGELIWKAGKNKSGVFETGNYYFKARVDGGELVSSEGNEFGTLEVIIGDNIPPVADITSPIDRQIYFLNEQLNFSQASYDIDSTFNWTWDFGDGSLASGDITSMNNYNLIHGYNTTGQKSIKLTVIDDEGASSIDRVTILVVNSTYILAYIDSPRWGSFVGTGLTLLNASGTYAVNVTHNATGVEKIECLAGYCPAQTEGCPPPQVGCHVPVLNPSNLAGFANVQFNWVFDNNVLNNRSGNGIGNAVFYQHFEPGIHTARLTASI
ncbi:MAG: PKD domain-containing protein [Nanoarchaeota archaeon]|nr:PKD domain-containing protein [Nanoarchaeota archaeon]